MPQISKYINMRNNMWINMRNKKLQLLHYAVEQLHIMQIKKAY